MRSRIRLLGAVLTTLLLGSLAAPSRAQILDRYGHTTTLLPNGNVLITGGFRTGVGYLESVEMFISTAGIYQTVSTVGLGARSSHTATLLPDGRVFIAGGYNGGSMATVRIYNPNTNSLTDPGYSLTNARFNHTATLLPNGKVLISGGVNTTGAPSGPMLAACELFDFAGGGGGGSLSPAASLGLARAAHTTTLLADGRVLIAGGYIDAAMTDFAVSTEFYEYNTGVGRWSPGPALIAKRYAHSATQLGNGKVLIAGGFNGKNELENYGYLDTAELYDPVTDTIVPAKSLAARKSFHSASLLGDGKTQLYGGIGNITTTYATFDSLFTKIGVSSSVLYLDTLPTPLLATGTIETSNLHVRLQQVQLSVPVTGRIVHGEIRFSSPIINLSDSQIHFTNPGTVARLDGVDVEGGKINDAVVTLNNGVPTGEIIFWKRDMKSADGLVDGRIFFMEVPLPGTGIPTGESRNIDSDPGNDNVDPSRITVNVSLTMPKHTVGARVLQGSAKLISGSVSNQTAGYNLILTSGTADLGSGACQTISLDESKANGNLSCNGVVFNKVSGIVQSATSVVLGIPQPLSFVNQYLQNISVSVEYVLSQVTLDDQAFDFDISTIAIREMIFADAERYDPSKNTWSFGATPGPAGSRYSHSSVLLPNADDLILGGRVCDNVSTFAPPAPPTNPCMNTVFNSTRSGFGYILQQGLGGIETSWRQYPKQLLRKRRAHTTNLLPNGQILVAGGSDGPVSLSDAEVLDPAQGEWVSAGVMGMGHSNHSATLLPNGTVLVAGGFKSQSSTGATNYSELYFPETKSWAVAGVMKSSRSFHTAVLLPDGNVMVAGGFANGEYLNSSELYITTGHYWVQLPAMNTRRAQHTMTLLHNGKVLVAGGVNVGGVLGESSVSGQCGIEVYDPSAWQWDNSPNCPAIVMNSKRHSHTATLLRDGRVLAAGGNDGFGEISKAEIFNPAANAWVRTGAAPYRPGQDMIFPRINHTAQLLPNGKVLFTGGFDKFGRPAEYAEGFDVDLSSWQLQGKFFQKRGDHTCTLMADGTLMVVGGYDGVDSINTAETQYFTYGVDELTNSPLPRQPNIIQMSSGVFSRGGWMTMTGGHFTGESEASGGGAASGNSHHAHPRVYLQRMAESGNSGAKSSGFLVDLTSAAFFPGQNSWSLIKSSITVVLPTSPGLLPYGYYHLRVAANSQFSTSKLIQIGPARPTSTPGTPHGTLVGVSSVSWSWPPASGTFDGYSVYSATNGVFIATVAPTPLINGEVRFYHRNLGPDTSSMIKVAAYTLSGDGGVTIATIPVNTLSGKITSLTGTGKSVSSIEWSWNQNPGALYYNVYSASASVVIATPTAYVWTQDMLSTNTASCIQVQAVTEAGSGALTDPTTTWTLAAAPIPGSPSYSDVTANSVFVKWSGNTNPAWTTYEGYGGPVGGSTYPITGATTEVNLPLPGGSGANVLIQVFTRARNGYLDATGVPSPPDSYVSLGTTCTLANAPSTPTVTFVTPSSIGLMWYGNGNSTWTAYQVTVSTDGFTKSVSTPIAFSDNYSSTTMELKGLLTGAWYDIRVQAANLYGALTSIVSTRTYTDNGGGPLGSIGINVRKNSMTLLQGNVGSGRNVALRIFPNTFDRDLFLYISSQTTSWNGNRCGNLPAVTITVSPDAQPVIPFNLGISYAGLGIPTGDLPTLGIVRYDPGGRTCVPLASSLDRAGEMIYAKVNHLSSFQLMQLLPANDIDGARVFPNPLYTRYQGYFTFDRLPSNALVRVYTIHGERVYDGRASNSGLLTWNATNVVGRALASGVYFAVIENEGKKRIMKIAVVR